MGGSSSEYLRQWRADNPEKVADYQARRMEKRRQRVLSDQLCECGCGEYTFSALVADPKTGRKVGEPLRFRDGHSRRGKRHPNFKAAAPRKAVRHLIEDRGYSTPCWIWQLAIHHKTGYGHVGINGKNTVAHRAAYEAHIGPIPNGYQIDHMCHQRACVNPDHLQAVLPGENLWRMFMGKAELTPLQITQLRQWMQEHLTPEQIANVWKSYDLET